MTGVRRFAAPYAAVFGARYRTLLQYRAAAWAGAATQFFWGFIRIMILYAFYQSSDAIPPMRFADVVTYIWLGQALLGLQPWQHDAELEAQIRRGDVAYELLRPLDLYAFWYVRVVAWRVANTSLRCIPIFVVAGLVLPLTGVDGWALALPASPGAALGFGVALVGTVLLSAALTSLVHVSLLWTLSGDGVARVMPSLVMILSGMVVPLPLFPDWAQPILAALPFRGLVDVPFRVYSGDIPLSEAGVPIALSFVWTIALAVLGRALLARGHRVLVVQGG